MPSERNDSGKLKKAPGIDEGVVGFEEFASEISVHDTKSLLCSSSGAFLLDCREPKEHSFAHIEGSMLIPMEEVADRVGELEEYRDSRIVVYCHHGGRSLQVVNWLRNHGFAKAQNLTGGIDLWSQEIDPTIPRY
jgi:rhodanese-related sulfurtransferase